MASRQERSSPRFWLRFFFNGFAAGIHYLVRFSRRRFLDAIEVPVGPIRDLLPILDPAIPAAVKVEHGDGAYNVIIAFELFSTHGDFPSVRLGEIRESAPDLWRLVCFYSYLAEWSSILSMFVGFAIGLLALVALADGFYPDRVTLLGMAIGMVVIGAVNYFARRHCQFIAKRHGLAEHPDVEF